MANLYLLQLVVCATLWAISEGQFSTGVCSPYSVPSNRLLKRNDYQYTDGIGAHKFHSDKLKWNDARKACIKEGGHLAIINSVAEADVLTKLFQSSVDKNQTNPRYAFIGYHDYFGEGEFVTLEGDTLAKAGYSGWMKGQPDNYNKGEQCGSIYRYGGLNDLNCNLPYTYICELPTYFVAEVKLNTCGSS